MTADVLIWHTALWQHRISLWTTVWKVDTDAHNSTTQPIKTKNSSFIQQLTTVLSGSSSYSLHIAEIIEIYRFIQTVYCDIQDFCIILKVLLFEQVLFSSFLHICEETTHKTKQFWTGFLRIKTTTNRTVDSFSLHLHLSSFTLTNLTAAGKKQLHGLQ